MSESQQFSDKFSESLIIKFIIIFNSSTVSLPSAVKFALLSLLVLFNTNLIFLFKLLKIFFVFIRNLLAPESANEVHKSLFTFLVLSNSVIFSFFSSRLNNEKVDYSMNDS